MNYEFKVNTDNVLIYICYLLDRRYGWGETVPELLKLFVHARFETKLP